MKEKLHYFLYMGILFCGLLLPMEAGTVTSEDIQPMDFEKIHEELKKALSVIPWKVESTAWKKKNPDISCKGFQAPLYYSHLDEYFYNVHSVSLDVLWCEVCSFDEKGIQHEWSFYPASTGKACTLQKVRLSAYPSTYQEAWETNQELTQAIDQQKAADKAIGAEATHRKKANQERLYQDIGQDLLDVVKRLKKVEVDQPLYRGKYAEAMYPILVSLFSNIAKNSGEKVLNRPAQLYLADRIGSEIGSDIYINGIDNEIWEKRRKTIASYGVVQKKFYDPFEFYDPFDKHSLLYKIIEEEEGYWAEEAFLDLLLMGWPSCDEESYIGVISHGEDFLKKNPKSRIRKEVLRSVANAHETGWSLSRVQVNPDNYFDPVGYQADAPYHREKAIEYYQKFIKENPTDSQAAWYKIKLNYLQLNLDTASRRYYCHGAD